MADWLDVSDTNPRIAYTAGVAQTVFTVPFLFFANGDLKVYLNGVLQTLTTHYAVAGAQNPTGGTVTFLTAPATGASVVIVREIPISLTTHVPPSGPLDIAGLNRQFSRSTAQIQQVKDLFQRAITLPISDPVTNLTVPNKQTRAGTVLGFDAAGNPIATTPAFTVMGVGSLAQVRVASTGNINLAAPGATIDSVAMSAGQTFLAKDQSASTENGVYTWNGAAVAATRTTQFDTYAELVAAMVSVAEGTINAGTLWINTNGASGTLGVTAIIFVRVSPDITFSIQDAINVKSFGAIGDGVADDTAAIQAAINAAEAITLGTGSTPAGGTWAGVFLPRGVYLVTGLFIAKPIHFFGEGRAQTVLKLKNASNNNVLNLSLATSWFAPQVFEHFTIDGNRTNQTTFSAGIVLFDTPWSITVNYSLGCVLRDIAIHNARDTGIFIGSNRNDGVVSDVLIYNCDVGIINYSFDWRMYSVDVGTCGYGYSQNASGGTHLWGCNFYQSVHVAMTIEAAVTSFLTFDSCQFDNNGEHGIKLNGNGFLDISHSFSACSFGGNSASLTNTYPDIELTNAFGVSISQCSFINFGSPPKPSHLVKFTGTCGPVMWMGNDYQEAGNVPWATALTNDFTKLAFAGDRTIRISKSGANHFDFNAALDVAGSADFFTALFLTSTNASANPGPYAVLHRNSASPAAADRLGSILCKGKDLGGNDVDYAGFEARIIDPTDTSEDGEMVFGAMVAGAYNTDVLKIGNGVQVGAPGYPGLGNFAASGSIKSTGGTAGIGYATGAGGTVTQITSKATGVTLNKVAGQITMDAAALAANTTVSFTLTNSAIAATDILVLNHISGGTAGAYTLNAQAAAGSASINVRNVTAGSLSEAIVIGFAVVKAVTS